MSKQTKDTAIRELRKLRDRLRFKADLLQHKLDKLMLAIAAIDSTGPLERKRARRH